MSADDASQSHHGGWNLSNPTSEEMKLVQRSHEDFASQAYAEMKTQSASIKEFVSKMIASERIKNHNNQLTELEETADDIAEICRIFNGHGYEVYEFLTTANKYLADKTPLQLLKERKKTAVINAAKRICDYPDDKCVDRHK